MTPTLLSLALAVLLAEEQGSQNQEIEGALQESDSGRHVTPVWQVLGKMSTQVIVVRGDHLCRRYFAGA